MRSVLKHAGIGITVVSIVVLFIAGCGEDDAALVAPPPALATMSTASQTTITISNPSTIDVGNVIKIENEQMVVTAKNGNVLTVTRAANGTTATSHPAGATVTVISVTATSGVFVYWDQNEEEDAFLPNGQLAQLVPPWDPNGQMCVFPSGFGPDGGGGFVTGYNPTLPSQHNLGGPPNKPLKDPPVGEAVWDRHGNFTQTIYVPGDYALPGSNIGGDIPPDPASTFCTNGATDTHCTSDADCPGGACSGTFNDNGSFTGCAFDSKGNLFAADIGQAQGSLVPPPQGRIIEWFPPNYNTFCIIIGPTQGGVGPHHVNGTGGLRDPGQLAVDPQDNLYVTEPGNLSAPRVLKFDHAALPHGPEDCPNDGLLATPYEVFISGAGVPAGIARDPTCSTDTSNCWAVTNILSSSSGGPAISWFLDSHPTNVKGPVPAGAFSPFGVAVGPTGDVFFVDIALSCGANGCDTKNGEGGVFKVSFNGGTPATPQRIIGGLNFPVSVTVCDGAKQICPEPAFQATPITQVTPGPGE